ncbi:MAG: tRNA dihydrouridine(20/20a) synthase DusA [Acidobacteriota bacterium]|nr:tRNA dihydrouridine(20/20a) synthase DusA [Acidobacteriota bacterium]
MTKSRAHRYPLSVAPMMDRTDRHFRFFLRCITRRTLLYTEMVTTGAVIHGDRDYLLGFDAAEHPLALQLGGEDPGELAECARIARDWGYDEVNLNVGCPSDRVQQGRFGACLMAEPDRVARAVEAMRSAVDLPVTVKHRIGVDDLDRYEDMLRFVDGVSEAGADRFSVHARKAWLQGLSPKENRTVPPLRYEDVYRLKAERPHLQIEINGGILTLEATREHLRHVDAVMVGRAAYDDPYEWVLADSSLFGEATPPPTRAEVVEAFLPYVERWVSQGQPLNHLTRHILGLFTQCPGAKAWRRHLSENAHRPGAGPEVITAALELVPEDVRNALPAPALATAGS